MKKNNSLRIFNILAKRVYKLSKKRKLGWTWRDCQKWTSTNLFKLYKGKPISKIKVTEVDAVVIGILDSTPTGGVPLPTAPKPEICSSPFDIPTKDLKDINWWLLGETLDLFDDNLKVRIAITNIIDTDIIKMFEAPSAKDLVTDMRNQRYSSDEMITFKILVAPNKKDDGKPCSYYVLVTEIGSIYDTDQQAEEVFRVVSESDIPMDAQQKRKQKQEDKEAKEKERKTKKQATEKKRPSKVEGKEEAEKKLAEETLKNLESLYAKGLITKELYKMNVKELKQKLEKGGEI
jgi:hypothetical protein